MTIRSFAVDIFKWRYKVLLQHCRNSASIFSIYKSVHQESKCISVIFFCLYILSPCQTEGNFYYLSKFSGAMK